MFIALTALKEFWAKDEPIHVLGPWCFENDDIVLGNIDKEVKLLDETDGFIFTKPEPGEVSYFYENYLNKIAHFLNRYHGINISSAAWEILLGYFLHRSVAIIFERYRTIEAVIAGCKFHTITLSESSFNVEGYRDTQHYIDDVHDHKFNHELFTRILRSFGLNFKSKPYAGKSSILRQRRTVFPRLIFDVAVNSIGFLKKSRKEIFLIHTYLKPFNLIKYAIFSKFRVEVFSLPPNRHFSHAIYNPKTRAELQGSLPSDTHFEKLLSEILSLHLPICFLEGWADLTRLADNRFGHFSPDVIVSCNAWYLHEEFKCWTAQIRERSTLVGAQHGGNYGILKYHTEETFERKITDLYLTWGWSDENGQNLKSFFSMKLLGFGCQTNGAETDEILFVMTHKPKYFCDFKWKPMERLSYLENGKKFLLGVKPSLHKYIKFRPYSVLDGELFAQYMNESFSDVCLDSRKTKFIKSATKAKLVICDHLMTTYLEVLSINKPCLILIDEKQNDSDLRSDSVIHFDRLIKVGVAHFTISSLTLKLNQTYFDLDSWWFSDDVQSAVEEFCSIYARKTNHFVDELDSLMADIMEKR